MSALEYGFALLLYAVVSGLVYFAAVELVPRVRARRSRMTSERAPDSAQASPAPSAGPIDDRDPFLAALDRWLEEAAAFGSPAVLDGLLYWKKIRLVELARSPAPDGETEDALEWWRTQRECAGQKADLGALRGLSLSEAQDRALEMAPSLFSEGVKQHQVLAACGLSKAFECKLCLRTMKTVGDGDPPITCPTCGGDLWLLEAVPCESGGGIVRSPWPKPYDPPIPEVDDGDDGAVPPDPAG